MRYFIIFFATIFWSINSYSSIKKANELLGKVDKEFKIFTLIGIELARSKLYYSSVPFFKEALYYKDNKKNKRFDKYLDHIIRRTGREAFYVFPVEILQKSESPGILYILAQKYFRKKNYDEALKYAERVPKGHFFYPHALYLMGAIKEFQNEFKDSYYNLKRCVSYADSADYNNQREKDELEFIKDSCEATIARLFYKMKQNKKSNFVYNKIEKNSYKWPNMLLEDSWNSYLIKDFNRTIGRLYTFNAPILKGYFYAEAEILKVMSLVKMCYWDDAIQLIKKFETKYYHEGNKIVKLVRSERENKLFFFDLIMSTKGTGIPLLDDFVKRLRRNSFLRIQASHLLEIKKELRIIKKMGDRYEILSLIKQDLSDFYYFEKRIINDHIKNKLVKIINEIVFASKTLLRINLEIYGKQKKLVIKKNKVLDEDLAGTKIDVDRKTSQYFWGEIKEFWLDELGEYVFALESQCLK